VSLVFALSIASAETVETIIKQLKDPSPEVRIKAAEELCVS
jgi:HEAT repeat protein